MSPGAKADLRGVERHLKATRTLLGRLLTSPSLPESVRLWAERQRAEVNEALARADRAYRGGALSQQDVAPRGGK